MIQMPTTLIDRTGPKREAPQAAAPAADVSGLSCHAGKDELTKAAQSAGKSETLEQYAKDYEDRFEEVSAWPVTSCRK